MSLPSQLLLRPIQQGDQLNALSLGNHSYAPLKSFLRKNALIFHEANFAKTYVFVPSGEQAARVWGYLTLMNSEVILEKDQKPPNLTDIYKVFPAVKIARLAVDKALQRKGYGQEMLAWCVSLVKNYIMPHVGCRYLTVDAKKESVSFYDKLGFRALKDQSCEGGTHVSMFFDVYKSQCH